MDVTRIEAPDEAFIVTLLDASEIMNTEFPFEIHDIKMAVRGKHNFMAWCGDHEIEAPEFVMDANGMVFMEFKSDAHAVIFKLLWQKGCVSI